MPRPAIKHVRGLGIALVLASVGLLIVGAAVGSTGLESLWHWQGDAIARQIVWEIRLPRSLGAWLAGALLGLAGAVSQGLFRNPLADPYLLGSASGAALGSAVALVLAGAAPAGVLWLARLGMTGMAFLGAAAAVFLALLLAQGAQQGLRLLLAGVVVGVVLGAVRDVLELRYPDILQPMKAFGLGSTAFVGWAACALMLGVWLVCAGAAWVLARALDGLALGEATAASLGLPLVPMRLGLIGVLALATGTAVAQTGLIAFVGLAAPHVVRSLVQAPHRSSVLLASMMGAVLLLAADILARALLAPQELPVGVLTALLGGSYLLLLMYRRRARDWSS
ncbi:FecCD family ABC transporter permease [Comamonas nitrativorans]|uniref:FecCD family ABC transporter permease n=1 Tax=Comamonas nitrativorans TaxID=108437 RepID=A0ABV9GWQ5_9BURK